MSDDDILLIFFYVALPWVALLLGAVVAPFLYAAHRRVATLLNLAGLVLFVFCGFAPIAYMCLPFFNPDDASLVNMAYGVGLALAFFAAVEAGAFLLRRCLRRH